MKPSLVFTLAVTLLLSACATAPQMPIQFSREAVTTGGDKIGVVMTSLPKTDTYLPGAGCLLCMAVASAANSTLTTYTRTLSSEDLLTLKRDMAASLQKQGMNVTVISDDINLKNLPDLNSKAPNTSPKDFSSLGRKYNVDKLLVIDISMLGIVRTYADYIPTSDPKGMLKGAGYIVNLKDNSYQWYMPVDIAKSADGNWDEPPKYPGLTNAYYQALEGGKDTFLKAFSN